MTMILQHITFLLKVLWVLSQTDTVSLTQVFFKVARQRMCRHDVSIDIKRYIWVYFSVDVERFIFHPPSGFHVCTLHDEEASSNTQP